MEEIFNMLGGWGPLVIDAVKAFFVLVIGWSAAGLISGFVRRRVNAHPRIDQTLGSFAASIVRWVILLIVFVMVLSIFGIQATSLVAMLGAATLAIGMALRGTLSDIASGILIIVFRPYKLGDFVEVAGQSGTVKDISLFTTELATGDNIQVIIPNGQAWGDVIRNYSHHATRRCDIVFGIDYDDDMDKAKEIILSIARADERVLGEPEPWVRVTNLGDSSVDLTLRAWVKTADLWEVKFHLTKAVKEGFDAGGISIPYPHQVEVRKAG